MPGLSGLVAPLRVAPMAPGAEIGPGRNPGKCEDAGLWYGCDALALGRNCATDLSADRKAVRIAKGYLSFITKGHRGGHASQDGGTGREPVHSGAGQVAAGSQHPRQLH